MITLRSNEEAEKLIRNGVLDTDGEDLCIAFDGFSIESDIKCGSIVCEGKRRNIIAWNINAGDIKAWNINAGDINAGDIDAGDIDALDINAGDINALNINARNINAWDINALDINVRNIDALDINAEDINADDIKAFDIKALDINYYAVCFAYHNINCRSIKGRRENCKHFCLDGKITIKKEVED